MTNTVLVDAATDACNPGPAAGPQELLAAVSALDRPIESLNKWDECNALCDAFEKDYGFIRLCRAAGVKPNTADMDKWSSLLRWMLQELVSWDPARDPNLRILSTIFVAGTMSDIGHELWHLLPNRFSGNAYLVKALQTLLKSCKISIEAPRHTRSPISTEDAISEFAAANANQDWKVLDECLHSFGDYLSPSLLQTQATRVLLRCGSAEMLDVISTIDDALIAALFVDAIADANVYVALAISCTSSHFEFAALRGVLSRRRRPQSTVPGLETLLIKLAADTTRWRALMNVFNQYPIRYPDLQEPLGRALARCSSDAMQAYIDAIQLNCVALSDGGRDNVAVCLRAFRALASQQDREVMWKLAFDRWSTWDFDRSGLETHLLEVQASILDYAIVGYAIECLGANGTGQACRDILNNALSLHENWYPSGTAMVTDWNRRLAALQPLGHAQHILTVSHEDWLCKTRNYLPVEAQTDYFKLMYRIS